MRIWDNGYMSVIREIQEDLEASARRLFMEYHSQLLVEARALCADSASAEDLVMITLETYFAKPEKFDPSKGELLTWLKAVMRNHFRKSLRRKSHIDTIFLPADDLQTVAERLQPGDGQHDLDKAESDELIRRAVASLSPKVRDAVILHYFKDQSVERTASVLGISVDAAKNRLFCARQILHRRLKGRFGKSLAVILVAFLSLVSAAAVATLPAFEPLRETVAGWFGSATSAEISEPRMAQTNGMVGVPPPTEPASQTNVMVGVSPPNDSEPTMAISNEQELQETQIQETQPQEEKQTMKLAQTYAAAALAVTAAVVTVEADGVTLSIDKVQQRYPWNGLVDIDYTIDCEDGVTLGLDYNLEVSFVDEMAAPSVTNRAITFLQAPLPLDSGKHRITWDANADGVTNKTDAAVFQVRIVHYASAYMVIDVSGGSSTNVYPVSFLNGEPPNGFNDDEYKGDKIVLRRVHPGSFVAGSPTDEAGRMSFAAREQQHRVALSRPFYIGIFEVTQKQYQNVMGSNPVSVSGEIGNTRPVAYVSYENIRGAKTATQWQTDPNPTADSFAGKLIEKCKSRDPATGKYDVAVQGFDLPTDFQWEYACRAGTVGAFNTTNSYDSTKTDEQMAQLKLLGRYSGNTGDGKGGFAQHTVVGNYLPNGWGLYDMHGNVWEWCRDWFQADVENLKQCKDPSGPASGTERMFRGGGYTGNLEHCRSAYRSKDIPSRKIKDIGFRISRTLP